MSLTRRDLFEIWRAESVPMKRNSAVINKVFLQIGCDTSYSDEVSKILKQSVQTFCSRISKMWASSNRTLEVFLRRNKDWLNKQFSLPVLGQCEAKPESNVFTPSLPTGRPRKRFENSGEKSKLQKIAPLVESNSSAELLMATRVSLYKAGNRDAASILSNINSSPKRANKLKRAMLCPPRIPIPYTPEEALALYVDGRFTKNSYILMQSGAKNRNANIYPSYGSLKEAKKRCYPNEEAVSVTDISAEIRLQNLIDHTLLRLLEFQKEVVERTVATHPMEDFTMIYKWGCDGSAQQSTYRQPFSERGNEQTDEYFYAVCIVPLQLRNSDIVLWQNPRPSSTRFCRPIKLMFQKESEELIRSEISNVKRQITNIVPTSVRVNDIFVNIRHQFCLSMIDGKTFSAVAESSNQSCAICGSTPKTMNDLEKVTSLPVKESLYEYGLSTLHAWIRCLECVLHISYRLDYRKWQVRGKENRQVVEERKRKIIDDIKQKMHLLIDIPKPGFGTTNNGNTARRFFESPELASSITGVDERFIKQLGVILRTMACGYAIDVEAFRSYTLRTAKLYVELYNWYYMPSSLHKILMHGADIINSAVLPIGMLSEEAIESRNKDFRNYRQFHTRKMSREQTMRDLLNTLLFSSDPIISLISRASSLQQHYSGCSLSEDVRKLLSDSRLPQSISTSSEPLSSSDSET